MKTARRHGAECRITAASQEEELPTDASGTGTKPGEFFGFWQRGKNFSPFFRPEKESGFEVSNRGVGYSRKSERAVAVGIKSTGTDAYDCSKLTPPEGRNGVKQERSLDN